LRPGEFKIIAALVESDGLTYTELKDKTELSNPVLSQYLGGFVDQGMIWKNPNDRRYYLPKAYYPMEKLSEDLEKNIVYLMKRIPFQGTDISLIKNEELRKKIYSNFLLYHLDNISILIIRTIRNSVLEILRKYSKKELETMEAISRTKKKKMPTLAARVVKQWETQMGEYHSLIKERMDNWINPYIQMLALAYWSNMEPTIAGIDEELMQRFHFTTVKETFWFREIQKIHEERKKRDPEYAKLSKKISELERMQRKKHGLS